MDTFELVTLPNGRRALTCGWVQAIKRDANGNPVRHRARLVIKGFRQVKFIDFDDTYASVLRIDTWRGLIALAARENWDIHQLDVVGAFLNAKLEEEIYMRQIPGYEDGTNRVLRLKRALYGLKQAPRAWNQTINTSLLQIGYTRLESEPCVYRRLKGGKLSILALYVDDIALFTTPGYAAEAKGELMRLFKMRDMGELGHFLGFRVTRDRKAMTITLAQDAYVKTIVTRSGMADAKPNNLPMAPGTQLERYTGPSIDFPYARLIGSALYATLGTRLDAAFAVQHLSQFSTNPGPAHISAMKSLFRYFKGTSDLGITYHGKGADSQPVGFSDADWAQSILDRKSISGFAFMLCGGAISWSSKKQPTVAVSSMEGEYMALSLAVRHSLWLRLLFSELGFPFTRALAIHTDNLAAIALAHDPQFHGRSKHIDVRHHFIREHLEAGRIVVPHVSGDENLADILTKALPGPKFNYLLAKLCGRSA
jgi:hypothetical protein